MADVVPQGFICPSLFCSCFGPAFLHILLFYPFGMGVLILCHLLEVYSQLLLFYRGSKLRICFESQQRLWPFQQFGAVKTLQTLEIVLIVFCIMTQAEVEHAGMNLKCTCGSVYLDHWSSAVSAALGGSGSFEGSSSVCSLVRWKELPPYILTTVEGTAWLYLTFSSPWKGLPGCQGVLAMMDCIPELTS